MTLRQDVFLVQGPEFKDKARIHEAAGLYRNFFFKISGTRMAGIYDYNVKSEERNCTCTQKATVSVPQQMFSIALCA